MVATVLATPYCSLLHSSLHVYIHVVIYRRSFTSHLAIYYIKFVIASIMLLTVTLLSQFGTVLIS